MKVVFCSPLDVSDVSDDGEDSKWKLDAPFDFTVDGTPYRVPAGYETDFASVPRIPFAYSLAGNIAPKSATLHDWLYHDASLPREQCDKIFLAAMETENVSWFRRRIMYAAVRIFGGKFYGNADKEKKSSPAS